MDLIVEAEHGFEAWRKLCVEFEQLTAGRKLLTIEELLHPEFGDEQMWRARWLSWERMVDEVRIRRELLFQMMFILQSCGRERLTHFDNTCS